MYLTSSPAPPPPPPSVCMLARPARRLPHEVKSQHLVTGPDQSTPLETHQYQHTCETHTHTLGHKLLSPNSRETVGSERKQNMERNELHAVELELLRLAAVKEVTGRWKNQKKLGQRGQVPPHTHLLCTRGPPWTPGCPSAAAAV